MAIVCIAIIYAVRSIPPLSPGLFVPLDYPLLLWIISFARDGVWAARRSPQRCSAFLPQGPSTSDYATLGPYRDHLTTLCTHQKRRTGSATHICHRHSQIRSQNASDFQDCVP